MNAISSLRTAFFTPILAFKKRYIPLLLLYFSYGASAFSTIGLTFWEKENLSLTADQLLKISVWVMLPWTIKMIFGQLVDSFSLFGNRRKSYVFLGAGFVALGSIILAGMAGEYSWITWIGDSFTLYLLSALCTAFGFMIQDVTADAMSTEVVDIYESKNGKKFLRKSEDIQSDLAMVQILGRLSLSIAGVLFAGIGGVLAARFSFESIAWMTLILPIISLFGGMTIRLNPHESQEKSVLDPRIFGGGILFGIFSVFMAFSGISLAQELVFVVSLLLLGAMMYWITKESPRKQVRTVFLTLLVIFLYRAMPSSGPGFSWWAIDHLEFDEMFFGTLAQIGAIIALAVLWLFSDAIAHKPIRTIFFFLILAGTILDIPEMLLYLGVHDTLGISARSVALVDTSLGSPLVHISMVPMLTLIAFYAPENHRATWFAVAASLMNLATTGGRLFTKYLNQLFVVSREVVDDAGKILVEADYSALGALLFTKTSLSFLIPLVALLVCFPRKLENLRKKL